MLSQLEFKTPKYEPDENGKYSVFLEEIETEFIISLVTLKREMEKSEDESEDDYFVVSNYAQDLGRRDTYALKYVGATKSDDSDPTITFKDLGSGETITRRYVAGDTVLKMGGQTYTITSASNDSIKDFDITDEEAKEWYEGGDPCMTVIRVW
jgi:hypothetical protein